MVLHSRDAGERDTHTSWRCSSTVSCRDALTPADLRESAMVQPKGSSNLRLMLCTLVALLGVRETAAQHAPCTSSSCDTSAFSTADTINGQSVCCPFGDSGIHLTYNGVRSLECTMSQDHCPPRTGCPAGEIISHGAIVSGYGGPAGSYDGCRYCPSGKYSRRNSNHCSSCSSGQYASSHGSSTCRSCPSGQTSGSGASTCHSSSSRRRSSTRECYCRSGYGNYASCSSCGSSGFYCSDEHGVAANQCNSWVYEQQESYYRYKKKQQLEMGIACSVVLCCCSGAGFFLRKRWKKKKELMLEQREVPSGVVDTENPAATQNPTDGMHSSLVQQTNHGSSGVPLLGIALEIVDTAVVRNGTLTKGLFARVSSFLAVH